MNNVRKAKRYENIWTKTLALILRFVLGAGFIVCGFHLVKMYNLGVYRSDDYFYSSQEYMYQCRSENYSIAFTYVNAPENLSQINNEQNFEFRILTKDPSGNFVEYYRSEERNIPDHDYKYVTFINTVYKDPDNQGVETIDWYFAEYSSSSVSGNPQADLVIEIKTYDPADVYDDLLHEKYAEAQQYNRLKYTVPAITAALIFLGIMIAVFLFSSAGHDYGQEGIVLNIFDRMPFDLFSVFMGLIAVGLIMTLQEVEPRNEDLMEWAGIIIVISLVCMDLLFWLLSAVKRGKAGTLFRNNVTYHVLHFIYYLFVNLRMVWKIILIMAVYGLFIIICIGDNSDASMFIAVFGSILLALPILLWFIHADIIREKTEEVAMGDMSQKIDVSHMHGALKKHAENINSIQDGIQLAVAREMKSEHLKTELITNVSHDIKTPLTSIINYVDLLQKEHTEEEEKQYLEVLDRQSSRLKKLIEDLIEASKASTGNINADITTINVSEIISQSISEYREKFEENNLEVVITEDRENLQVKADGNLLWRVLNNLYNNICKYAQPNTRVYVNVSEEEKNVIIDIKNISREMLNISADELMERFVRGDSSRHTEGSGLGLNIARSLMDVMKGSLDISIDGDLFKSEITLPKA